MRRFLINIQFNGKNYSGWQKQQNAKTIQGEVELALKKLFASDISAVGCSRTDAGVSAEEYFFHFDADTKLPEDRVAFKLNRFLPNDIQAQSSREVKPSFDARKSVKNKTYSYSFYVSPHKMPLLSRDFVQLESKPNIAQMKRQAALLVGEHDFACFRTVGYEDGAENKNTVRTINFVNIVEDGAKLVIYVNGNGFLYNMVRILAGTLLAVGEGKITDLSAVLNGKDRSLAGETLSPKGLKLVKVNY